MSVDTLCNYCLTLSQTIITNSIYGHGPNPLYWKEWLEHISIIHYIDVRDENNGCTW